MRMVRVWGAPHRRGLSKNRSDSFQLTAPPHSLSCKRNSSTPCMMLRMTETKRKRAKVGTAAGAVAAFAGAQATIVPPEHSPLRECDQPFWADITCARAKDTWSKLDLVMAVNLARTLADLEKAQLQLDADGFIIENARGTMVENPMFRVLETLKRAAATLSKHLQVHSHATNGPSRNLKPGSVAQREAGAVMDGVEDDLIGRPAQLQ